MGHREIRCHPIHTSDIQSFLPPAKEVWEGYIFKPVCQSFCSQGMGGSALGGGFLHPEGVG